MDKEFVNEDRHILDKQKTGIKTVFNQAVENQLPLAIWRKPLTSNVYMALSLTNDTTIESYELENLGSGFLFSPFEITDNCREHFIKDDILINFNSGQTDHYEIIKSPTFNDINSSFPKDYINTNKQQLYYSNSSSKTGCASEGEFKSLVKKAIEEINEGRLVKVVPARCKILEIENDFSIIDLFLSLEKAYPNAFVYLVGTPETGMWLGATPENLISVDDKNLFKTTALAGTQRYIEGMNLVDAAWRQKEIEEQALVSRYIINCLKKIRLREFEEIGPKTVKAGNLIHLKTDFLVDLNEVNYPYLPTVMLNLLHPTSAICGMPKEEAMNFIHSYERFDRSYFSGFLGPVNIHNQTNLFVNIRCMQFLQKNKAIMYAGAGVTADSVPEKEWEETELKMETLLEKIRSK